ncbi:sensor histidine kinase [Streptomyces sp. SCSIO ZS0520]|uniref:sensor histidine kinase n=1 Tax=Streptomyces sp. SCSIO ZS0520 TaxID=2892996 RepID=UPI0021D8702F|nr:histidine kinase [Streptomyces sp. SCSIO ZS0520]
MTAQVRSGLRLVLGLVLGALLSAAELLFVVLALAVAALAQLHPHTRRTVPGAVRAAGRRLVECERARLGAYLGMRCTHSYVDGRALLYLAARWPLGLLGIVVLLCALLGGGYGSGIVFGWILTDVERPGALLFSSLAGLVFFFMAAHGLVGVGALERGLARHFLGPGPEEELRRRIDELFTSRAEVVEAVHEERRRIERDLHDGVQQRIVSVGILLARSRRSREPTHSRALVEQAYTESRLALAELREVAWRVYPATLDDEGLGAALETLVERSDVPAKLDYRLAVDPQPSVAAVVYFVVAEAVTNTVKHASATRIEVVIEEDDGMVRARVEDDGSGGADARGSGLTGLARRTAALDGRFEVRSPLGGPTVIATELPCD